MSFGSQQIHTKTLTIDVDPAGTDKYFYVEKAPGDITIKSAHMVVNQSQNAGTATLMRLENWGTAGTAVEGTVSTYLGGTASAARLTAATPASAVISSSQDNIDVGEWLVVHYTEEGTGWISGDRLVFTYSYVYGVGA